MLRPAWKNELDAELAGNGQGISKAVQTPPPPAIPPPAAPPAPANCDATAAVPDATGADDQGTMRGRPRPQRWRPRRGMRPAPPVPNRRTPNRRLLQAKSVNFLWNFIDSVLPKMLKSVHEGKKTSLPLAEFPRSQPHLDPAPGPTSQSASFPSYAMNPQTSSCPHALRSLVRGALIAAILAASSSIQAASDELDTAEEYYKRAMARFENYQADDALRDFDKAIELDPKNAEAYAERGRLKRRLLPWRLRQGRFRQGDQAQSEACQSLRLPGQLLPVEQVRWAIGPEGHQQGVAARSEGCRVLQRARMGLRHAKGVLGWHQRDGQGDRDRSEAGLFCGSRGQIWLHKGDRDRATEDANTAIQKDPKCVQAYTLRARIANDKGLTEAAIDNYSKAIELNPRDGWLYASRGDLRAMARGVSPTPRLILPKPVE